MEDTSGKTPSGSTDATNPFSRVSDLDSLSSDFFLERFQQYGFFWCTTTKGGNKSSLPSLPKPHIALLDFLEQESHVCKKYWTVENQGDCCNDDDNNSNGPENKKDHMLTPQSLSKFTDRSFYVSTIIHRNEETTFEKLNRILSMKKKENLTNDSKAATITSSSLTDTLFQDVHITGGAWIFLGHMAQTYRSSNKINNDNQQQAKKRSKNSMVGRAEHVDEVVHSGTYHIQLSGNKTWYIRPHPELYPTSVEQDLPDLSKIPGVERSEKTQTHRLRIEVQEGDIFVLNTKIWYHFTELSHQSDSEWSISVARDFYLPVPCPHAVRKGEVIFGEEHIPDEIPRTGEPNCALIEVEDEPEEDNNNKKLREDEENEEDETETTIVLVALKDIDEGEFLSIAIDDGGDDDDRQYNADEMVDPRAISKEDYKEGQVVLQGDDLPEDLPRSLEPNCELQVDGDKMLLRALQPIQPSEIFCILPEDNNEYEQVDVDLATGELHRSVSST